MEDVRDILAEFQLEQALIQEKPSRVNKVYDAIGEFKPRSSWPGYVK